MARSATHMAEAQRLLDERRAQRSRRPRRRCRASASRRCAHCRGAPSQCAAGLHRARGCRDAATASRLQEMPGRCSTARADAQPEVALGRRAHASTRRPARTSSDCSQSVAPRSKFIAKSWRWSADRECILNERGTRSRCVDDAAGPIDLDRLPRVLELRARSWRRAPASGPRARARRRSRSCCRPRRFRSRSARACRCCSPGIA